MNRRKFDGDLFSVRRLCGKIRYKVRIQREPVPGSEADSSAYLYKVEKPWRPNRTSAPENRPDINGLFRKRNWQNE
ncbi:hypothetical protein [Larkinella rosea]|uniref:Uncharacterized protein n=1 Tax=Larkinella rosea TaxID=2025312 RepID=A0A3P1BTI3_9BACT|nr:hypothetical protein [Larkinella rosea]RRB04166.1 hypothetical protein EHT25_11635 [Larkinella rosea]